MLSHLARTRVFKCLCALKLSLTLTRGHLCAGFLPPDAISCVKNNAKFASWTSCASRHVQKKKKIFFLFLNLNHNQVDFKHHMHPPPLPLPSKFSSKHNHAHSASTMKHYASLVAMLFSKSLLRLACFLPTIPPLHPAFYSLPLSRFKMSQSEFSKVAGEALRRRDGAAPTVDGKMKTCSWMKEKGRRLCTNGNIQ